MSRHRDAQPDSGSQALPSSPADQAGGAVRSAQDTLIAQTRRPRSAGTREPEVAEARLLVATFLGGATGTLLRAALATAFPYDATDFPLTTLLINLLGAAILGAVTGRYALAGRWSPTTQAAITTGLLSGFTTYSTFVLELTRLPLPLAVVYAGISLIGGVLLAWLGLRWGTRSGGQR